MDVNVDSLDVTDNDADGHYEVRVDGHLAVIEYERLADRITFIHTSVPPELEGHGIAGRLARVALDDARTRHLAVIPRCPYVAAYIKRHPEYLDLVPEGDRSRVENA